tara:strand:- start:32305 stop:32823 length:519 start_codon:yes stop_codon:yes gene_type:complete
MIAPNEGCPFDAQAYRTEHGLMSSLPERRKRAVAFVDTGMAVVGRSIRYDYLKRSLTGCKLVGCRLVELDAGRREEWSALVHVYLAVSTTSRDASSLLHRPGKTPAAGVSRVVTHLTGDHVAALARQVHRELNLSSMLGLEPASLFPLALDVLPTPPLLFTLLIHLQLCLLA